MTKKGLTVHEFLDYYEIEDMDNFLYEQKKSFKKRFSLDFHDELVVALEFDSADDALDFYNEIKLNKNNYGLYKIFTTNDPKLLKVSGERTLFDYFGTREPNLLTASRDLDLEFKIDYVQEYSKIKFIGHVIKGELLSRQLIVEYNPLLPELSLGGLRYIANDVESFDLLLSRFYELGVENLL